MAILTILAALSTALTPALCVGGALEHPCDCPAEVADCGACCEGDSVAGAGAAAGCECLDDAGCSHDDCENDPCEVGVAPDLGASHAFFSALASLPAMTGPAYAEVDLGPRRAAPPAGPPRTELALPYHASDIPLRS